MMFSKNRVTVSAGIAGAALLLAACAPGSPAEEETTEQPPAESVDPADFAGETLNYVYFTDGPDEEATRDLIGQFEEEYDVTVELEVLPYADLVTSVQARLSGGNAPDVVRLTGLTDFRADLLDLTPYLGDDYADQFLPGPTQAVLNDDGAMIAVPSDLTLNGPFVNTDLFEEAGVDLPDPEDPWTWEEMIDAAKQVQEATGTPYAFAMDKSGHRLATVLAQYGTQVVDGNEVALDEHAGAEALQPLVDMMAEDTMPRDFWLGAGSRYSGANEIFLAQDVPVYLSGNWQVAQFAANADFGWAAVPNPCAAECGGFPGGKYMAAFSESDNPALAATFVEFMNTAEAQEQFVTTSMFLPTRADLAESGVSYPDRQEDMDLFLTDLNRTPDSTYNANAAPAFAASGDVLIEQLDLVVAGEQDLATAMSNVTAETESLVAELGS